MGDRANIKVREEDGCVYLYTHWGGFDLPLTLQNALKRHLRWTDAPYLSRIIFQEMIGDDKSDCGFGIWDCEIDPEYPLLVVDCKRGVVIVNHKEWPFSAYCGIENITWEFLTKK